MGAWGLQFNENDDAADWIADFGDTPDWQAIDAAFEHCSGDYVEAPECSNALAAAEVVAAGLGKASPRLDGGLASWAMSMPEEAQSRRDMAVQALSRVRDDSELKELWEETDEFADWTASVNETLARL